MDPKTTTGWDEYWAWIDEQWRYVRKAFEEMGTGVIIVEDYEYPGKLYRVYVDKLRRGEKPTESPEN